MIVSILDSPAGPEFLTELILLDYNGSINSFLLSFSGFQELSNFSLEEDYPGGVADAAFHAEAGLLFVAGQGSTLYGSKSGLGCWRLTSEAPFYQKVELEGDSDRRQTSFLGGILKSYFQPSNQARVARSRHWLSIATEHPYIEYAINAGEKAMHSIVSYFPDYKMFGVLKCRCSRTRQPFSVRAFLNCVAILQPPLLPSQDLIYLVELSPSGDFLAAAHVSGALSVWTVPSLVLVRSVPLEEQARTGGK